MSEKSGRTLRRWMPVERLRYAQVKKKRRRRKIVAVTTRVVYGTKEGLLGRLRLVMDYYNFCLAHLSLREELPKPMPTKGNASPKKWMPRTPAMAAGITDHVWTMGEFLMFRVPPWRQEGAVV